VHYLGPRAAHPFVPLNCGALPDTLLEDELFGHERGAFTDARERRSGLLSQAERGTLFLDEIDSLTPRAQVALLRILQGGTYRALGGDRERPVDVRFVAATNAWLPSLVASGRFRSDLYYRLSVLTIHLPPLRQREEDILPLAVHFLAKHYDGPTPPRFSSEAEHALLSYSWPGNVRELENVVQRAIAMARLPVISEADLGLMTPTDDPPAASPTPPGPDASTESRLLPFNEAKRAVVDAFERDYLQQALREHRGNVSRAAQSARKERRDFGRLLKKHQLDPREF
jgi:DNA-binding NtrC family response regulator